MLAKGQDPGSIDCVGSSHIMRDLWPQRPLWFFAWEGSCGQSWHSSPVGQDIISLHCKECNTICNDWTTDSNNLHEKQVTHDLFLFFISFSGLENCHYLQSVPVYACLFIIKSCVVRFISQIMKLINWSRTIKCQTVCIFMRVNISFMVNLHDKWFLKSQAVLKSLLLHYVMGF